MPLFSEVLHYYKMFIYEKGISCTAHTLQKKEPEKKQCTVKLKQMYTWKAIEFKFYPETLSKLLQLKSKKRNHVNKLIF